MSEKIFHQDSVKKLALRTFIALSLTTTVAEAQAPHFKEPLNGTKTESVEAINRVTSERTINDFAGVPDTEVKGITQNGKGIIAYGYDEFTGAVVVPHLYIGVGEINGNTNRFNLPLIEYSKISKPDRIYHIGHDDSNDIAIIRNTWYYIKTQFSSLVYRLNRATNEAEFIGSIPAFEAELGGDSDTVYGLENVYGTESPNKKPMLSRFSLKTLDGTPARAISSLTVDLPWSNDLKFQGGVGYSLKKSGDRIVVIAGGMVPDGTGPYNFTAYSGIISYRILPDGGLELESSQRVKDGFVQSPNVVYEDNNGDTLIAGLSGRLLEVLRFKNGKIETEKEFTFDKSGWDLDIRNIIRTDNGFALVSETSLILIDDNNNYEVIKRDHPIVADPGEPEWISTWDTNPELVNGNIVTLQNNGEIREIKLKEEPINPKNIVFLPFATSARR